jgi:hypothetical protein
MRSVSVALRPYNVERNYAKKAIDCVLSKNGFVEQISSGRRPSS